MYRQLLNMATKRLLIIASAKFNVAQICTRGNYAQKYVTKL